MMHRCWMRRGGIVIELAALVSIFLPMNVLAQGGRGGRGNVPPTGKAGAPIDVTGYWTAVITEDWHVRMLTAPKGDFGTGQPGTFPPSVGGTAANPANGRVSSGKTIFFT